MMSLNELPEEERDLFIKMQLEIYKGADNTVTGPSTEGNSLHLPRLALPSDVGGPTTTTLDHTRNLDGGPLPRSPSPSIRAIQPQERTHRWIKLGGNVGS